MSDAWHRYAIDFHESFHLRRPVLEAMGSLGDQVRVSEDGTVLELERPLWSDGWRQGFRGFSPGETKIIEFSLSPYSLAEDVFNGLSKSIARTLAKAIYELFGPGGFYDDNRGDDAPPRSGKPASRLSIVKLV